MPTSHRLLCRLGNNELSKGTILAGKGAEQQAHMRGLLQRILAAAEHATVRTDIPQR